MTDEKIENEVYELDADDLQMNLIASMQESEKLQRELEAKTKECEKLRALVDNITLGDYKEYQGSPYHGAYELNTNKIDKELKEIIEKEL